MGSSQYLRKYLPQSNLLATIQQLRATITHSLQMSLKTLPLLWEYLYHYQELYSQCFRSGRERGQSRELPPKGGKISPRDLLGLAGAHALHTGTSLPHLSLDHMQKTRWAGHTNYIFFQSFPNTLTQSISFASQNTMKILFPILWTKDQGLAIQKVLQYISFRTINSALVI